MDVQRDVQRALPPLPLESHAAHAAASEIYGSSRMLLAVLEREQLGEASAGGGACMCTCVRALRGAWGHIRSARCRPASAYPLPTRPVAQVCRGWRCDMWEALAPLRALRPLHGGAGYCFDTQLELRALNFEVPPPGEAP